MSDIIRGLRGYTFRTDCPLCGQPSEVKGLRKRALDLWAKGGVNILDAFPHLSSDEREILISGMHSKCFDDFCPDDEDDEFSSCRACAGWEEGAPCTCPRICGHADCTGPDA